MTLNETNQKLTGKDLINIGIFSAVYFVLSFIGMFLGIIPILWILMPGAVAILTGIPFLLLSSKIQKPSVFFLMGGIIALLYYLTGQFTFLILITFLIGTLLSEVVRRISQYRSFKGNALSFILFSYGMTGSPLPVWLFREEFLSKISSQGIPSDYIETLRSFSTIPMLMLLLISPIVGGLIGSILAKLIFKKHFEKAGIL